MKLSAVLLAAGLSRRYGSDKLLAEVDGVPLYRRAFAALPAALFFRAAVVGRCPEVLEAAKGAGYLPILNPRPQEGQSVSIRLGLSAVEADSDAVLFSVCDQPWLSRESVEGLIAAWREAPDRITALSWDGKRGNPVIFPRKYYAELSSLTGDVGGGRVIRAHPDALRLAEALSPRELQDLDVPLG